MVWKIVTVEYFDDWFLALDASEQQDVLAAILVLEQYGPMLGRRTSIASKAQTR